VPGLPTNVRNLAIAKDPTTGGPILTPAWEAPTDKIAADLANLYVSVNQTAPAATALVTLVPGINGTSATLRLDGVATASQSAVTGVWGQKAWVRGQLRHQGRDDWGIHPRRRLGTRASANRSSVDASASSHPAHTSKCHSLPALEPRSRSAETTLAGNFTLANWSLPLPVRPQKSHIVTWLIALVSPE
jgi:hypothetical protein